MKAGDIAYYYECWSNFIIKCEINEIKEVDGETIAKVKNIGAVDKEDNIIFNAYGTSAKRASILHFSLEAAYKAYNDEFEKIKNEYMKEIKTIEDLVQFPLDHCLTGDEYIDYKAVAAYKEKARELLGINL